MRLEPYADGRLNDELTFPTNGAATVMPFTYIICIMYIIYIIHYMYMYIYILYLSWGIPHFRKLAESMGWDNLGWSLVVNVVLTRGSWWHKLRKIRCLTQSGFHQHTSHSPAKIRGGWDFYFNSSTQTKNHTATNWIWFSSMKTHQHFSHWIPMSVGRPFRQWFDTSTETIPKRSIFWLCVPQKTTLY